MKYILAVIALGLSVSAGAADVDAACKGCHQLDKAAMGPSIKQLAGKFSTVEAMEKSIKAALTDGSKGKWPGGKAMMKSPGAVANSHALAVRYLELAK